MTAAAICFVAAILRWYCREFHPASALSRPVCGEYVCFLCMQRYRVPWESEPGPSRESAAPVFSEEAANG